MDLQIFPIRELDAVLGALRNVAVANDSFTPAERALIEGVARIHDVAVRADDLIPLSFTQIGRVVTDPHRQKRAVDLGHVLAGYDTEPQGELQQAAFQAGFVRNDGFTFLLFGIVQFHLGLRITPIAKGYEGLFDVPRVLEALRRGAACNVDLTEGFDLFANQDRPLDEVRAELGIPPLETAAAVA